MTRLLSLYPQVWRDRYGDEFLALMEDRPPDALDRVDIVRGAIDARLRPQVNGDRDPRLADPVPYNGPWSAPRAGWLTLAGGFLFLATIGIALSGPVVSDGSGTYRDGSAAFVPFFFSIVLLGIGVWAVAATVPSSARVARTAALVGGLAGVLWGLAPWMFTSGVLMSAGIAVLVVGAARAEVWRRSDAGLLIASIGAAWAVLAAAMLDQLVVRDVALGLFLLLFSPLWFVTAHALLRPARPIAPPADLSRLA